MNILRPDVGRLAGRQSGEWSGHCAMEQGLNAPSAHLPLGAQPLDVSAKQLPQASAAGLTFGRSAGLIGVLVLLRLRIDALPHQIAQRPRPRAGLPEAHRGVLAELAQH